MSAEISFQCNGFHYQSIPVIVNMIFLEDFVLYGDPEAI